MLDSQTAETITATVSYVENADGSYTVYQYENAVLKEAHTTTPGSGRVDSVYCAADGSCRTETDYTDTQSRAANSDIPDSVSEHPLGNMNYLSPWTYELFTIKCYVREAYFSNRSYTFYKGKAQTLAKWTAALVSVYFFHVKAPDIVLAIITGAEISGLLEKTINGLYTVIFTKTITCDYFNQELHGDPVTPAGLGNHGRLDGTLAFIDYGDEIKTITEGYTTHQWGNNAMGRQMMYKVFQMDVYPTSWTNVD